MVAKNQVSHTFSGQLLKINNTSKYILCVCLFQSYIYMFPKKADSEVNLSMVWCLLAIGFAYKILASLTGLYFEGDDGTETNFMQLVLVLNLFVPLSTFRG